MAYMNKIIVASTKCSLLSISLMPIPGRIRSQFITDFGIHGVSSVSAPVKICNRFTM